MTQQHDLCLQPSKWTCSEGREGLELPATDLAVL